MSTRIPYANLGGAKGENWPCVQGCSGVDESGVELRCKPICWMRDINHRFARSVEPTFHPEHLADPFHWREPRRILVAFTGDTFGFVEGELALHPLEPALGSHGRAFLPE